MKMYVAFLFLLWFAVAAVGGKKHSRHLNFTSFHILTNAAFTFFLISCSVIISIIPICLDLFYMKELLFRGQLKMR